MSELSRDETDALELGFNRRSAREFWKDVLLLAALDRATTVRFQLDPHNPSLSVTVAGKQCELTLPPREYHEWLFKIGGEIIVSNGRAGILKRWHFSWLKKDFLGTTTTDLINVRWTARCSPANRELIFERVFD